MQPIHAAAFKQLNVEWLQKYFEVEPHDEEILSHPDEFILQPGGVILMALDNNVPIGCVALMPKATGPMELTKMAVTASRQGQGIGVLLMEAVIARARQMELGQIMLVSNRQLTPALTLYRKFGFQEVPNSVKEYARCDIQMLLNL